ncbi:Aste57867_24614 [Aphanomyces stellatus]|uniref:Aste57867_24614 protein n=1 Tax=Aphanomyces stellatus TaxID=120398 RepID=A0A485LRJ9_9STRA|nr:hypothetical protein As57867_024536 [Aphanomyces stellatus]VFU01252.1 Aste57867_24614 [Aphanomyces stellatus]
MAPGRRARWNGLGEDPAKKKLRDKEYRETNKDMRLQQRREMRPKYREKERATMKAYYKAHKVELAKKRRAYYVKNAAKIALQRKEYAAKNRHLLAFRKKTYRMKKQRVVGWQLTSKDALQVDMREFQGEPRNEKQPKRIDLASDIERFLQLQASSSPVDAASLDLMWHNQRGVVWKDEDSVPLVSNQVYYL